MKQFFLLIIIISFSINFALFAQAQCGYHPPKPQAETRQKSSVNISQGIHDLDELTKISEKEAKKIATSKYRGKVKVAKLVIEDGTLAWKLEVKGNEGQKEIFVDPSSGTFLGFGLTK